MAQAPDLEYFQEISMTAIRTNTQPSSTDAQILPEGSGSLLNRLVDRWVADIIARREREAARVARRERHRHVTDIARERQQRRGQAG
jgi:hypothetical protein